MFVLCVYYILQRVISRYHQLVDHVLDICNKHGGLSIGRGWHCDHSAHPTIRPGPAIEKTCTWRKYGTNGPMGALLESIYWVSNSVTMPTTKHVPESLQTTARWGFTNKTQHSTGFTSTGINNAFHSAPAYSVGSPAILVSLDHDGPVKLIPTRRPLKTEEKTPGVGRKETYL